VSASVADVGAADGVPALAALFAETTARALVATADAAALLAAAAAAGVPAAVIGTTGGDALTVAETFTIPLAEATAAYQGA
jgi:phosphoribosylformylglycinamidine synthase